MVDTLIRYVRSGDNCWLMVAGAIFVVLGFIGFAFRQNKNVVEPDHGATEMKAKGK
jgi:hypothetical protein